jgi:hypothetical protein
MRKLLPFLLVAAGALALQGCGEKTDGGAGPSTAATNNNSSTSNSPDSGDVANVVGRYKAEIKVPAGKANDPAAKMAEQMAKSMSLELKADKTFVMNMMLPFEGTYAVSGDKLTLTMTKMMGMTLEDAKKMAAAQGKPTDNLDKMKAMPFKIEDGGKRLVGGDPNAANQGSMVFVRE